MERGERLASASAAKPCGSRTCPRICRIRHRRELHREHAAALGLGAVERALKPRKHRPIFMVDLAVPRDIEPEVKALEDVYLYTVDDLAQVVQQGHASRQAAVAQAEVIIDAGVQSFMHWLGQRGTVPLIRQLNAQTDEWRATELARARKLLAKGESVDAVLEALSGGSRRRSCTAPWPSCMLATPQRASTRAQAISRLFLRNDLRGDPRTEPWRQPSSPR